MSGVDAVIYDWSESVLFACSFLWNVNTGYNLIFVSCGDCPSYLASAEAVRDLLLPA